MSIAHDTISGGHLWIRKTREEITSNFYWPGIDGDVARYCHSGDVCQKTVNKGTIPKVPFAERSSSRCTLQASGCGSYQTDRPTK